MAENSEKLGKESEKSLNNEFEAIISEIDRIGLQEIQIPSSGSNIILASDNESILYSNDFGISVCCLSVINIHDCNHSIRLSHHNFVPIRRKLN